MASQRSELEVVVRTKDQSTASLKNIESGVIRFVGAVSSLLAVLGSVVFPIKAAADFQKELLDVGKTTGFTSIQIKQLSRELKQLATTIDLSAIELAQIAAVAGQLGLGSKGVEGITQFTETAARFASVIDITAESSAQGLAKLANIFDVPVRNFENISSLLNELSNNSTASGEEIINIVQRIGTAGGTVLIGQSAALASFGRDVGLTVETIGTSVQKIFLRLQTEADQAANLIGIPVTAFTEILNGPGGGIEALKLYTTALARLPDEARAAAAQKITGGGRVFGFIQKAVDDAENGFTLLNARLENARVGFDEGTSSIEEQARVLGGFNKQLALVRNALLNLAESIGREALPFLTKLAKQLQEVLADPGTIVRIKNVAKFIGGIGVALVDTVRFMARFGDEFGIVIRIIQVIVGLKLAGYFINVASSLAGVAQRATLAAVAFQQLAAGQRSLASAAAQRNAGRVGQAGLGPIAGNVAAGVGSAPRKSKLIQLQAIRAQQAADRESAKRANILLEGRRRQISLQKEMIAGRAAEARIVREIGIVQASNSANRGRQLRSLRGQLALHQSTLQANVVSYRALTTETLAAANAQKVLTASAIATSKAAAATSAAGLTGVILGNFRAGVARAIPALISLGKRIVGLILPVAFWAFTIATIVGLFGGFENILDNLARIVGFSGTARQRARLDSKIRAESAEAEAEKVEALSEEYRKAKEVIESFSKTGFDKAIGRGELTAFLTKSAKELELVQAELKQNETETEANADSQSRITAEIERTSAAYHEQTSVVAGLKKDLRQLQVLAQGPRGFQFSEKIKKLEEEIASASATSLTLWERVNITMAAGSGLLQTQNDLLEQRPILLGQEAERVEDLSKLYDDNAKSLLDRLIPIAQVTEELDAARKTLKGLADDGKEAESSVDFTVTNTEVELLEASLARLKEQFIDLRSVSSKTSDEFLKGIGPDVFAATESGLRRIQNTMRGTQDILNDEESITTSKRLLEQQEKSVVTLSTQLVILEEQKKGLQDLADRAQGFAEDYKAAFERASNAAEAAVRKSIDRIAEHQERLRTVGDTILLANFDDSEKRAKKLLDILNNRTKTLTEQRLKDLGFTEKERDAIQHISDLRAQQIEEERSQGVAVKRQRLELDTIQKQGLDTSELLTAEERKQAAIRIQIANLRKGDVEGQRRLAEELAASVSTVKVYRDTLEEISVQISEIAATPIEGGIFTNTILAIDPVEATASIVAIEEILKRSAINAKESARVLQVSTSASYQALSDDLGVAGGRIKEIEQELGELAKTLPKLAGQFRTIGNAIAQQIPAFKELIELNKQIKNADFNISLNSDAVKAFTELKDFSDISFDVFMSNLSGQLTTTLTETFGSSQLEQAFIDLYNLKGTAIAGPDITFSGAKAALDRSLNQGKPINVPVNLVPSTAAAANVPGKAEGGFISGPGTGTSDSILARLSHGEFVSDAATVSRFGASFFDTLKSIAKGGVSFPSFAGGGLVGAAASGGSGVGGVDVVRLDFNINGQTTQLAGERGQVNSLVKALRNISRGV